MMICPKKKEHFDIAFEEDSTVKKIDGRMFNSPFFNKSAK